jgi:dihydroorotase
MNNTWFINQGRIIDPVNRRDEIADLFIKDGVIATVPKKVPAGVPVVNAAGLVVAPGLIDLHVHFREPGNENAETIESGCRAAAHGGFTTVVIMPNTTPATDNAGMISAIRAKAESIGLVTVLPTGCITRDRRGTELAELAAMAKAGAVAFTDDGSTVPDGKLMANAMKAAKMLGIVVMDHALDPALAGNGVMHEGNRSRKLGLPGIPSAAESEIVKRDIALAEETGCRIHIQHVSAKESVELIREARRRGLPVSGEATPHHLALIDDDVTGADTNMKVNPPVRSKADRQAILAAVADGTLEILATDHAPHTGEDKSKGFIKAPFGMVGLETAVGVTFTLLVKSGLMSINDWLARWTAGPAHVLGLQSPSLSGGQPADLVLLDLESGWTVNAADFLSKSRNTPFNGRKLSGRAVCTFHAGLMTWNGLKSND